MRITFEDWTYDSETRQVLRGGVAHHLTPKAFELLGVLLSCRPRVVPKTDLKDRLWPDTFVSEANLTSLVAELREVLADDARQPRFVRTAHGFGYAFCGEAAEGAALAGPGSAAARAFRIIWQDREIALRPGDNLLGRVPEGVAWIDSESVSRRHARVAVSDEGATIEDLGSKNGTFVNGRRVAGASPLKDGDEIRLGSETLRFREFPIEQTTKSLPDP